MIVLLTSTILSAFYSPLFTLRPILPCVTAYHSDNGFGPNYTAQSQ